MATASGNKVEIRKRRQNDNEEGDLKKDTKKVTKKASTDTRCSVAKFVETEEMRTIKKLIPERNDASTRVASKLSSLQIFSAVISLLEGEAGRFVDRWFRPKYHYSLRRKLFVVSSKLFYGASQNTQRRRH